MKRNSLLLFIIVILCSNALIAQETSTDEIHIKNVGTKKGKVISIDENTVEFRSDSNYMYYTYPKADIDFIVLSSGEWITFKNGKKTISTSSQYSWGYFCLSGGGIMNQKPLSEATIRKRGLSFSADLNYQIGRAFSTGFQIGYNEISVNNNEYLTQNGYSGTNSTITGGTSYLFSVGLVNRIFLLPNASVKPIISFFVGYGNLLISRTEIISPSGGLIVSDLTKYGFLSAAGIALFIETGTRSGFLFESKYNWLFYKKEKIEFLNFNVGYAIPIN